VERCLACEAVVSKENRVYVCRSAQALYRDLYPFIQKSTGNKQLGSTTGSCSPRPRKRGVLHVVRLRMR
jgi:hypothetical protein